MQCGKNCHTDIAHFVIVIHCVAILTILYGNYYPPHGEFELICIGKFAWTSLNSMGKIAKGSNKIYFTMLYGNYCYIFIENFSQKLSACILKFHIVIKGGGGIPLTHVDRKEFSSWSLWLMDEFCGRQLFFISKFYSLNLTTSNSVSSTKILLGQ